MSITLDTITLPEDLEWSDEYDWSPVGQNIAISMTGALIIEEAAQQKGRPITLKGNDEQASWATKTVVEALRVKAATPGGVMTLNFRGTEYVVMFRRDQTAVTARQVAGYADPLDTDYYSLTIRLMEV